jgi:hypothetical protein
MTAMASHRIDSGSAWNLFQFTVDIERDASGSGNRFPATDPGVDCRPAKRAVPLNQNSFNPESGGG